MAPTPSLTYHVALHVTTARQQQAKQHINLNHEPPQLAMTASHWQPLQAMTAMIAMTVVLLPQHHHR